MKNIANSRLSGSSGRLSLLLATVCVGAMGGFAVADDNNPPPATSTNTNQSATQAGGGQPGGQAAAVQLAPPAQDVTHGIGVGALFGEPTGLSLKGWVTDHAAIDGAVGYSFKTPHALNVHSDFLWHNFDLLPVSRGKLPFYFGVGGRVKAEEHRDTRVGVRFPVGLAYMFDNAPVDVFVEIAPIADVSPSTKFGLDGGVGVRYWFR